MFAVDVLMRVDGARTDVGVVARDDVAAAVANERDTFLDGPSRTGGFDHDIDALSAGALANRLQPFLRRRRAECKHLVGAHLPREGQSRRGIAHGKHGGSPGQSAERDRAQANGADALDEDAVAGTKPGPFADVYGGQEAAAAADVVVDGDCVWKARNADAGLEVDVLRPTAVQTL